MLRSASKEESPLKKVILKKKKCHVFFVGSVLSDHYSRLTTTDDGRPAVGERGLTNRKKKGKIRRHDNGVHS